MTVTECRAMLHCVIKIMYLAVESRLSTSLLAPGNAITVKDAERAQGL